MPAYASLRASDADRDAAAERLRRAAVEGRLEPDELEQRLDAALRARTYGELNGLLVDLPSDDRRRRPIAYGARSALAITVAILVTLAVVAAVVAVVALAAAGWMIWVLVWFLACAGRGCSRRRAAPPRRVHRARPAGLI
jgi:Domain of unknown function (DUF1707)